MLAEDGDLLKTIIEQPVQQVLEAEMDEALQAGKGERSEHRLGYRSGLLWPHARDTCWQDRAARATGPARTLPHRGV